jgi:hypothetical protein
MGVPISNVTRRVVYVASGTGPYNFTFEILSNTDVAVYRDDALLTLTTDYTVTINSNGTGYVTLVATPTGATQIAIVGDRTIQRMTDFVTGGDFFANTVNDEMDQQTIFAQQNAEGLQRALQAPQTDPTSINMVLPRATLRAGRYLGFDASGNPIADGDIPDTIYYGPNETDPTTRKNGTALQTGDIYFNTNVNQLRTYSTTTDLWFEVSTTTDVTITRTGTAVAGQTSFNFSGGYRVGTINVFVNGVLLFPADYTATNGTSITFASALSSGDQILVQSIRGFSSLLMRDITRTDAAADATSITPNIDAAEIITQVNTQTAGALTINAPSGTPVDGQRLMLRITSTNVHAFVWNAVYAGSTDLPLPGATSGSSKTDYLGLLYNSTAAKWQLIAKNFGY